MEELEDRDTEVRLWGDAAPNMSSPSRPNDDQSANATILAIQQTQIEDQSKLIHDLIERARKNENELYEMRATKRKAEEEEEPIAPPKIVKVSDEDDDAWQLYNKSARSLRPFCGNWEKRFKDLGRKAEPSKERLDWGPMGSLTIAPVTIKKLHDRGSDITIKMFWPRNHDVVTKSSRISINKDNSFLEPALDFKNPRETWEFVEALHTYTLVLHRVWPEDWTGLALMRILINYRWLSNCGKSKSTQMQLLTNFVNQVFSLNAANGRITKPPLTYKEIEDVMSEMVWTRGIEKSINCAGKDPYASSQTGVPQTQVQPTVVQKPRAQATKRQTNSGSARPSKGAKVSSTQDPCRAWNTPGGCNHTACRYNHLCNRYITSNTMCLESTHNADSHP